MKTADALARLHELQELVLAQIHQVTALASTDPRVAREPLAKVRWTLIRLLREYQLFKHGEIFAPAIACGEPARAAMAQGMKARCLAAGDAFAAHVKRWSTTDVAGRWDEYRPAMLAMSAQLRDHVIRERAEVERLLAGSERTRLLAGTRSIA